MSCFFVPAEDQRRREKGVEGKRTGCEDTTGRLARGKGLGVGFPPPSHSDHLQLLGTSCPAGTMLNAL